MIASRKQVEAYYEDKWSDLLKEETLSFLVEQTCSKYKVKKIVMPELGYGDSRPNTQNLGEI